MDHAVHYRTAAGETKVEEVGTLDAAVSMVERLRNDEGVSDVRVYRQIPIEFKAYYKVSVLDQPQGSDSSASAPASPEASRPQAQAQPPAQPQAQAGNTSAPQSPPPGAMPLGPSTVSQPVAQPSGESAPVNEEGDTGKRGSLFSRG